MSMRVTLVRHGQAEDQAPSDEERALTLRGRADVRRVGRTLKRRRMRFDVIVSSPLVRAVQTAEILAAEVKHRGPVLVERSLVPEGSPGAVVAFLDTLGLHTRVALVAHEPILSSVLVALVGRLPGFTNFKKGEAIRVRLAGEAAQGGEWRWRIRPDTGKLQRLG